MPSTQILLRSFAGGEISTEMYGRLDLDKFQTGAKLLLNFVTLPHGPAQSRAGFAYVNEAKDSTRPVYIRPFSYSAEQTMLLEFGHHYVRFHTRGQTLVEATKAITGITAANPAVFTSAAHGLADNDTVYLDGVLGPTNLNGRFYKLANTMPNTFSLLGLDGSTISTGGKPAYVSGGTVARVYTLVTDYDSADIQDINYTQDNDVLTLVHPSYKPRELRRLGATNWQLQEIDFIPSITPPQGLLAGALVGTGTNKYEYVVTAVNAAGVEESYPSLPPFVLTYNISTITIANPAVLTTAVAHGLDAGDRFYIKDVYLNGMPQLEDGVYYIETVPTTSSMTFKRLNGQRVDSTAYTPYDGSGGTVKQIYVENNLGTAGNKNELAWDPVTGAQRYNIYRQRNGLYGYIGQSSDTRFFDDNITPDMLRSPPDPYNATPFDEVSDYPGAVGYHDQRRVFAGTNNRPANFWMTRPGTEDNLSSSIPTQEDDAISNRVVTGQQNRIRHVVSLDDLILLTAGAECRLVTQNSDRLGPGTFGIKTQTFIGCSKVKPIVTANAALFVQARGAHLRELSYNWEKTAYSSPDISIMAPHLFKKSQIMDMTFTLSPLPVAWLVRDDGVLLGCTYVPDHKVVGWHHHDTQGAFESVAAVTEDNEDVLYAVVRRVINGRTVRYIERLADREFTLLEDAFCVDSGLTYDGDPTGTINNLWHLEGMLVSILADGGVHPQRTVVNGSITLQEEASKVQIGLGFSADFETLPITLEQAAAYGRGLIKNVNKILLRVDYTNSIWAGPDFAHLTLHRSAGMGFMGSPPPLLRETIETTLLPAWNFDGGVCVRQTDPLPITIVCLVPDEAV